MCGESCFGGWGRESSAGMQSQKGEKGKWRQLLRALGWEQEEGGWQLARGGCVSVSRDQAFVIQVKGRCQYHESDCRCRRERGQKDRVRDRWTAHMKVR